MKTRNWRDAGSRGLAALLAVIAVFHFRPARAEVGDIFTTPAPSIGSDPPKSADIKDGDTSVASQTGSLNWSYQISVPPGRNGAQPHLSLSYASQGQVYGTTAASGWNWNLSIPEIREDTSAGRIKTRTWQNSLPDPKVDDRFVSSMAGGRSLILVSEPGDPDAYQYRANADATFARYERLKNPGAGAKWRVYSTDGTVRYFGESGPTSKCANISENLAPLTREVSPFGDEVLYTYTNGATVDEWCVVTTTEVPPGNRLATCRQAVMIQRVQVPSR